MDRKQLIAIQTLAYVIANVNRGQSRWQRFSDRWLPPIIDLTIGAYCCERRVALYIGGRWWAMYAFVRRMELGVNMEAGR